MRHAGAGRRPGRLQRRVPRRRPRHEDGRRGALPHAGRGVPQRRLHPEQGAAARRRGRRRDEAPRRSRHRVRRAADRPRGAARLEGQGRRQADRRPRRDGQGAQGRGRPRRRPVPRRAPRRGRADRGPGPGEDGREEGREVRAGHHRGGLAGRAPALHSRRSARPRLHRRARARGSAQADAGDRRRHHRPRDGHGLLDAGRPPRRGRDARRPDAGRRSRPRARLGEDEQAPLRPHHGVHEDDRGRGAARCAVGDLRRPQRAEGAAALRRAC